MPVRDLRRLIGGRPIHAKRRGPLVRPPKTPRVSDAFRIARFERDSSLVKIGRPGEHDPHYSLDRTCATRFEGIDQYGSHLCAGVAAALARAARL
jgi:hypothetical protein